MASTLKDLGTSSFGFTSSLGVASSWISGTMTSLSTHKKVYRKYQITHLDKRINQSFFTSGFPYLGTTIQGVFMVTHHALPVFQLSALHTSVFQKTCMTGTISDGHMIKTGLLIGRETKLHNPAAIWLATCHVSAIYYYFHIINIAFGERLGSVKQTFSIQNNQFILQ